MAFVTPLAFTCNVFPETCREESSTLIARFAEPAVEPLAHNPEQKQEKNEGFKFGQNRPQSTLDRVMSKLN